MNKFSVQINGGKLHELTTHSGIYKEAAMAAIAMIPYRKRKDIQFIKIWTPSLIPHYGPYVFAYYDGKICSATEAPEWMLQFSVNETLKSSIVKCPVWINKKEPEVFPSKPKHLHLYN